MGQEPGDLEGEEGFGGGVDEGGDEEGVEETFRFVCSGNRCFSFEKMVCVVSGYLLSRLFERDGLVEIPQQNPMLPNHSP